MKPKEMSAVEAAFPVSVSHLMPPEDEIPSEFWKYENKWNQVVGRWFFGGLPTGTEFDPVDGIDKKVALRHLRAVLGSFDPSHEYKTAAVAYLLSQWFTAVRVPDEKPVTS